MIKVYLLSVTLLLAGCTSPFGIDVADAGRLPEPAAHKLQFAASADTVLTERVTAALTSRGFKVAEPADYLVQVVSSELPGKTGLFLPGTPPDAAGKQVWLTAPSRSSATQTRRVTITLTDIATGREVYRASGDERYRAGKADSSDALIGAVVGQLADQNAIGAVMTAEEGAT